VTAVSRKVHLSSPRDMQSLGCATWYRTKWDICPVKTLRFTRHAKSWLCHVISDKVRYLPR